MRVIAPVTDAGIIEGYLRDASNLPGHAEMLFRPRSTAEVAEVLAWCQSRALPVTVTARRTSTTGAPVPQGGALLSTERLDRVYALDDVDGGVVLGQYQAAVEAEGKFFPPDPTSRHDCSVGGAVACNASGARTFKYGPTRHWVAAVELVLPTGDVLWASRDTMLPWAVPQWTEPRVKTAAGLFPAANLLDLVIGSEGLLGVVTRVRTKLVDRPAGVLTFLAFFPDRESMLSFLAVARGAGPRCIEYFDRHALALIAGRVPHVPAADSALMLEVEHEGEAPVEGWYERLVEHGALVDDTLVVTDDTGLARLHAVRHALPAAVNEIIVQNGVQKVGTDFAVPHARLAEMLELYDRVPMRSVCFGHIGDSHLHLNLLPGDAGQLAEARAWYTRLAESAVAMGGTVSGEHGIGRLKKAHLAMMVPPAVIDGWRALKREVDPAWTCGRGVMFDP